MTKNGIIIISICISLLSCKTTKTHIIENETSCIGTTYFNIIDNSRDEIITEDPTDKRDIMVKIWYPAKKDKNMKPLHMWHFTNEYPLPVSGNSSDFSKILKTPSESYLNATPLQKTFPVVLYSHGYYGNSVSNQLLIEHLVKKGYIVVSVAHNHQASIMIQHDGTPSFFDNSERSNDFYLSKNAEITGEELNQELYDLFGKELSESDKKRVYQLMELAEGDHKWIEYWISDFNSVLEVLNKINIGERVPLYNSVTDQLKFKGTFDLERILALGSSMGGIVSLDFSNQNRNCLGVVNLDAIHYSLKRSGSYSKPYLYFHQGGGPLPAARLVLEQQSAPAYLIGVDGAKHIDFTDGTYFMREWFDTGTIEGSRMIELMNETVGLFFDYCLNESNIDTFSEYISNQKELSVLTNS